MDPSGRRSADIDLLARQTRMLELVAHGASMSQVLEAVAGTIEQLLPGCRCSILLLDEATKTLRHGAAPSLPDSYNEAMNGIVPGPMAGSCGAAAFYREPVVVPDVMVDERWDDYRHLAIPHGLRACWSTPVFGRGGGLVLGTFAVYHNHPYEPGPEDYLLIERFSHLAAVAIEHHRLFTALRESEERFRRAFEDNAVAMALVGLDGRFVQANDALCRLLGRDNDELLAMRFLEVTHPEDSERSRAAFLELTGGSVDTVHLDVRLVRADGTSIATTVVRTLVRDADGRPMWVSAQAIEKAAG